jgi:G-protein signaling modulator 2
MDKLSFNELASEGERLCKSGDCQNGIKYFEQALEVHANGDTNDLEQNKVLQTLSIIYNQIGNAYFYLQNYKKALEYHKNDLSLSE